jgi:methylmalonyl-CoA/ethylmalonyl-CoA epimerase
MKSLTTPSPLIRACYVSGRGTLGRVRHGAIGPIDVLSFDHTALAVEDIASALAIYRDLLGGELIRWKEHVERGFGVALLRYPNGAMIELIEPIGGGFVRTFLDKRGEGVHHLTFLVSDLRNATAQARAAGMRVLDESYARPRWFEAFLSPRSAHGTIVQLAQTDGATIDEIRDSPEHLERVLVSRASRRAARPKRD